MSVQEDSAASVVRSLSDAGPPTLVMPGPSVVTDGPKLLRLAAASFATLDAIRAGDIDEPVRQRLADAWSKLLDELATALSPEGIEELRSLALVGDLGVPTQGELRVLHAQLAGWLGGVFMAEHLSSWAASIAGGQALAQLLAHVEVEPASSTPSDARPSPYL